MKTLQRYNKTPAELAEILRPFGVTGFQVARSKVSMRCFCSCGNDIKEKDVSVCPHCGGAIKNFHRNCDQIKSAANVYLIDVVDIPDGLKIMKNRLQIYLSEDESTVEISNSIVPVFLIEKDSSTITGFKVSDLSGELNYMKNISVDSNVIAEIKRFAPRMFRIVKNSKVIDVKELFVNLKAIAQYPFIFNEENAEKYPNSIKFMFDSFLSRLNFASVTNNKKYSFAATINEYEDFLTACYVFGMPSEIEDPESWFKEFSLSSTTVSADLLETFFKSDCGAMMLNKFNHSTCNKSDIVKIATFFEDYSSQGKLYELSLLEQFVKENFDQYQGNIVSQFKERLAALMESGEMMSIENLRNRIFFPMVNESRYNLKRGQSAKELVDKNPMEFIKSIKKSNF